MMQRFDEIVTDRSVRLADVETFLRSCDPGLYRGRYVVLATSGSTGLRSVFLFSDREWIRAIAAITRPISWAQAARKSGRPARAARGARVLLTVFGRYTQPLIRYELSDLVRVVDQPCPCGRPYRVVAAVDGREEDILEFPGAGGQRIAVHPNRFRDALEQAAVAAWQIEQNPSGLLVRVVGANPVSAAAVDAEIRALLTVMGIEPTQIELRRVSHLERGASGKAPLIVARSSNALLR